MSHAEAARAAFTVHEVLPTGEQLDQERARTALIDEWKHTGSAYPYVTDGMVWEVKRYALAADVALPADLLDKAAVREFVDAAKKGKCTHCGHMVPLAPDELTMFHGDIVRMVGDCLGSRELPARTDGTAAVGPVINARQV
jgi:hypothetical protein